MAADKEFGETSQAAGFVQPAWPAPDNVAAVTTTRLSPDPATASDKPYDAFNLAMHVGDDPAGVQRNRMLLKRVLRLPSEPVWLRQVHSDRVVEFHRANDNTEADAIIARNSGEICLVQTADCLPVLMCDRQGGCVAAVHAGWRGLRQNIIAKTLEVLRVPPENLLAWFGPAISAESYEVDETVYRHFVEQDATYSEAFTFTCPGHWRLDLYRIARLQLQTLGVTAIYGGEFCTYRQAETFYSYRRDGQTGRMASLIWLQPAQELRRKTYKT